MTLLMVLKEENLWRFYSAVEQVLKADEWTETYLDKLLKDLPERSNGKNREGSCAARAKAEALLKDKNYVEALREVNKAVIKAPFPQIFNNSEKPVNEEGIPLTLAFICRSDILFAQKRYKASADDLMQAFVYCPTTFDALQLLTRRIKALLSVDEPDVALDCIEGYRRFRASAKDENKTLEALETDSKKRQSKLAQGKTHVKKMECSLREETWEKFNRLTLADGPADWNTLVSSALDYLDVDSGDGEIRLIANRDIFPGMYLSHPYVWLLYAHKLEGSTVCLQSPHIFIVFGRS